ncbi:Ionotropic receptor 766 [Blattella germanica]|nr:Ionotropic receptor 766 [Blattella germanica]
MYILISEMFDNLNFDLQTCCFIIGSALILSKHIVISEETNILSNCVIETCKSWFTTQDYIVYILQVTEYMYDMKGENQHGHFSSQTEILRNPKYNYCSKEDLYITLYKYTPGKTEPETDKLKNVYVTLTGVEDEILRKLFMIERWSVLVNPISYSGANNLPHMKNHIILLSYSNDIMLLIVKLEKQIMLLISHGLNRNGRYVLILIGRDISEGVVLYVLTQMFGHGILNVLVLVQVTSELVNLYTSELYVEYPKATVLFNTCYNRKYGVTFKQNATQYPDHSTMDLQNHCFSPGSSIVPFTLFKENKIFDGLDFRIAQLFARYVNANVLCTAQTTERFLVNTLDTYINPQYLASKQDPFVSHYYTVRYTFFVPVAESYPRWSTLTRVFSPSTWICGFFYLLLTGILLRIFARPEDPQRSTCECLLYSWSTVLAIGVDLPRSTALRIFFLSSITCSLSITTVFQSFFTSYLVNPGLLHQIDSLQDLEEFNFSLIFDSVKTLMKFVPASRLRKQSYFLYQGQAFIYALNTPKTAIFTYDDLFTCITEYMCSEAEISYHKFTEDVMQFHVGLSSQDFPVLQDRLNTFLRRIVEAGIPDKIMADLTDPIGLRKAALKNLDLSGEYVQMTLQHLQSPFYFWLFGLAVTLFIFVIEYLLKCIILRFPDRPCWLIKYKTRREKKQRINI